MQVSKGWMKEKRDCASVIHLIQVTKLALARAAKIILTDEVRKCLDEGDLKESQKLLTRFSGQNRCLVLIFQSLLAQG